METTAMYCTVLSMLCLLLSGIESASIRVTTTSPPCQEELSSYIEGCLQGFQAIYSVYMDKDSTMQTQRDMENMMCREYESSLLCLHLALQKCPPANQHLKLMGERLSPIRGFMMDLCHHAPPLPPQKHTTTTMVKPTTTHSTTTAEEEEVEEESREQSWEMKEQEESSRKQTHTTTTEENEEEDNRENSWDIEKNEEEHSNREHSGEIAEEEEEYASNKRDSMEYIFLHGTAKDTKAVKFENEVLSELQMKEEKGGRVENWENHAFQTLEIKAQQKRCTGESCSITNGASTTTELNSTLFLWIQVFSFVLLMKNW